jgi:lipopolysaccharide heptosyltransferase II
MTSLTNQYRNILIIRQSALGDVANILPAIKVLRDAYPQAKLTCLTGRATSSLLNQDPCLDDVIIWDRPVRPDRLLSIFFRLWRNRYDLVVDLHSSRYSRWLAWATNASKRVGAHYNGFYTDLVSFDLRNMQISDIFRRFLQPLGLENEKYIRRFPCLDEGIAKSKSFLFDQGMADHKYVVFNPGHSPAWGTKRWPVRHWISLGKNLVDQGLRIVVAGGPTEFDLATEIADGIGAGAVSAAGKTDIFCLAGLLNRSGAVVSTDSGPMHVAAMAGARVVALFGPTHPVTSAPFGTGHKVLHHKLHCSYCFKKVCPYQHECLDEMKPDEVINAVQEILASNPSNRPIADQKL